MMETCANCGSTIGNLETPMVWKDSVVCGGCYKKLQPTPVTAPPVQHQYVVAASPPSSTDADPTRIILALAVVGGIVVIVFLIIEWMRRSALIQSVGG